MENTKTKGKSLTDTRASAASDVALNPKRRALLRAIGVSSAMLPSAYLLSSGAALAKGDNDGQAGRLNGGRIASATHKGFLVRDFHDANLELMRLLKEVAEVEHALMLQYLYAAFSLKPRYSKLMGTGIPTADDLIGIAVQEMQHLGQVNRLLTQLGGSPCLARQDFPYEPDIYPCSLDLEPMSRKSLAKYVYAEAPVDATDPSKAKTKEDKEFVTAIYKELGADPRENHVGSVYQILIAHLTDTANAQPEAIPNIESWIKVLEHIMEEGEVDHYKFLRSLFVADHPVFKQHHADVWSLDPSDPSYPAHHGMLTNPSGYIGHDNQIKGDELQGLAWLSNLHYWSVLVMLDVYYRYGTPELKSISQMSMLVAIRSLGAHLPKLGTGLPFDHLSIGYAPCLKAEDNLRYAMSLLLEAENLAGVLKPHLPSDYPMGIEQSIVQQLRTVIAGWPKGGLANSGSTLMSARFATSA